MPNDALRYSRSMRVTRIHAFRALSFLALVSPAACSPGYVVRAGIEEAKILSRRRPIPEVIADPATSPETQRKLRLVLEARDFAERVLQLEAGDSYTTYSRVDSDTLLLVVTASRKDRFQAHTWWFPIIGHVPYKGFFDFAAARREAARLEQQGLDTQVRPSAAFSTLGWFNDPVLNTLLRSDDVGLVATVIHEIFHNSLFVPSHVAFNESLASFAGDRGAIAFFCTRDGPDSRLCAEARDAWHDTLVFGDFLTGLVRDLGSLYSRANLSTDDKITRRTAVFDSARSHFDTHVQPRLRTSYRGWSHATLNNATLIGTRLYYDRLDAFERVYDANDSDIVAALEAIRAAVADHDGDPWDALARLAGHGSIDPGFTFSGSMIPIR
jgi:predicted aminopeptidase